MTFHKINEVVKFAMLVLLSVENSRNNSTCTMRLLQYKIQDMGSLKKGHICPLKKTNNKTNNKRKT